STRLHCRRGGFKKAQTMDISLEARELLVEFGRAQGELPWIPSPRNCALPVPRDAYVLLVDKRAPPHNDFVDQPGRERTHSTTPSSPGPPSSCSPDCSP